MMKMKSTKTDMSTVDSIVDESMCLRTAGVSAVLLIIIDTLHEGDDDDDDDNSMDQIIDRSPATSYGYSHLSNKLIGYIDHILVYDHCRSGSGDSSNSTTTNNYQGNNNYQGINNSNRCQDECLERGLVIRNHYNRTVAVAAAVAISMEKKSTMKEIKINSYTVMV